MLDEGEGGIELFQLLLLCGPTLPVVDGIAGGEETFSLTPGQSEKTSKTEKHLYRLVFTKIITSLKSQSTGNLQHSFLLNVTVTTSKSKKFICETKTRRLVIDLYGVYSKSA